MNKHIDSLKNLSPTHQFIAKQGLMLLDGGLATELEKLGNDLNHKLWSARVIREKPDDILKVHRSFLEAGADCITSASYQATLPGLVAAGATTTEAAEIIQQSVDLACGARDRFVTTEAFRRSGRLRPLVAASVGPYGAFLADGSEYKGKYDRTAIDLRDFHEARWEVLMDTDADLLACETIPCLEEAMVFKQLLEAESATFAWFSFSCRDGEHISDGTPIRECAELLKDSSQVVAMGVNCTPPRFIAPLIEQIRAVSAELPIIVYPNSGETYDVASHSWAGVPDTADFSSAASDWLKKGASIIGGCCRTGPDTIRKLWDTLIMRQTDG